MVSPEASKTAKAALREANRVERSFWTRDVLIWAAVLLLAMVVGGYLYVEDGRIRHTDSPPPAASPTQPPHL